MQRNSNDLGTASVHYGTTRSLYYYYYYYYYHHHHHMCICLI